MLKKGNEIIKSSKTITKNKKLEKAKNCNIEDFEIEDFENYYTVKFSINDLIEPYMRHRNASKFKNTLDNKNCPTKELVGFSIYDPLNTYKDIIRNKFISILNSKLENNHINFQLPLGKVEANILLLVDFNKSDNKRFKFNALVKKIIFPLHKPDIDNVAKTLLDICNGIFYKDDNQVCKLIIEKKYYIKPMTIVEFKLYKNIPESNGRVTNEENIRLQKIIDYYNTMKES